MGRLRTLVHLILFLAVQGTFALLVSCQSLPAGPHAAPSDVTSPPITSYTTAQPVPGEDTTRLTAEPIVPVQLAPQVTATPWLPLFSPGSRQPAPAIQAMGTFAGIHPNDSAGISGTPDRPPPLVQLSTSLYFQSPDRSDPASHNIWLLTPGTTAAVPLLPDRYWVTAFDVSSAAGQVAFGTQGGQLYTLSLGEEPVLRIDASLYSPERVTVEDVAWSPEGGRLAFTLASPSGVPEHQDGLFWIDLDSGDVAKLVENYRLLPGQTDVSHVRRAARPFWSPDGSALAFSLQHWEWSEIVWIEPVAGGLVTEFIRPSGEESWVSGAWSKDGDGLILSNADRGFESDLVLASRDGTRITTLVSKEEAGMRITSPVDLSGGIAFLGHRLDAAQYGHIFLGQLNGGSFAYQEIGPKIDLCAPGYTRRVFWHPAGDIGILTCEEGAFLISSDGQIAVNLAPYLGPVATHDFLHPFWGSARR